LSILQGVTFKDPPGFAETKITSDWAKDQCQEFENSRDGKENDDVKA
jgi:hypothetical protein